MPNLFVSYSRQELTFVDSFTSTLAERGYDLWVDFRELQPGLPWQRQIDTGIDDSETVLLIVSDDSMQSNAVEHEWRRALANDKRIILILFEAVDLPGALADCTGVDFRGNFDEALDRLEAALTEQHPQSENIPRTAPDRRTVFPPTVQWFRRLAVITTFTSMVLVVPFFQMLSFLREIRDRTYEINAVQTMLLYTALLAFVLCGVGMALDMTLITLVFIPVGTFPIILLLMLQFTPGMYRWSAPAGANVRTISQNIPVLLMICIALAMTGIVAAVFLVLVSAINNGFLNLLTVLGSCLIYPIVLSRLATLWIERQITPDPIHITISHAPEDGYIIQRIQQCLEAVGHTVHLATRDDPIHTDSDTCLIALSRYHQTMPENVTPAIQTYTLLLDDGEPSQVDDSLTRIQWIDLRRGATAKIPILAHTVHRKHLLQKYLGMLPARNIQRPGVVRFVNFFFSAMIAFRTLALVAASLLLFGWLSLPDPGNYPTGNLLVQSTFITFVPPVSIVASILAIYIAYRGRAEMRERRHRFWGFGIRVIVLAVLASIGIPFFGQTILPVIWLMLIPIALNWRDLRYWCVKK